MRLLPFLLALAAPAAVAAQPAPTPPAGSLFLSPMGEPFRSDAAGADNVAPWFAGADRDGDGALTVSELRQEAARFFALLDGDRDGEIEPAEIGRYENDVAPEVQLGLQMRAAGGWRGRGRGRRSDAENRVYAEGLEGAGRFSFLNIPQPVIAADFDMNRGVSGEEFARAAGQRFLLLDSDRDGRVLRAELPPLPRRRSRRERDDDEPWDPLPIGKPR